MTTNIKKKWDQLEICQQFAHKLFWSVYTWLVLVDLIFLWSVNKLAGAVTKWIKACDKRSARLISYIHHTREFRQCCFCGKHSTTMQKRTVSRFWFCGRPWRLNINIRWTLMHFRKSNICANQLDVQEKDLSLTQLNRSWGYFSGCKFTNERLNYFIPHQTKSTNPKIRSHKKPVSEHHTPHEKPKSNWARQSGSE